MHPIIYTKTSINPRKKIEIDIFNNKNRLQIIRLETILGHVIKKYYIYTKGSVGIIEFEKPTSFKIEAKIIPSFN